MEGNPLNLELTAVKRIKLLERVFESFNLDGRPPEDSLAPDIEWHPIPEDPDFEVHEGEEAVRKYLAEWTGAFEDLRARALDVVPSGDKVLVWVRLSGKMRDSDSEVDMEQGIVYTFREGEERIAVGQEFKERAEAEKAAGIR